MTSSFDLQKFVAALPSTDLKSGRAWIMTFNTLNKKNGTWQMSPNGLNVRYGAMYEHSGPQVEDHQYILKDDQFIETNEKTFSQTDMILNNVFATVAQANDPNQDSEDEVE